MKVISALKDCAVQAGLILMFPVTLLSPMGEVKLTEDERRALNTGFLDMIWQSGFSKSFLVWRRRLLFSASFFLAIGAGIRISVLQEQCGGLLSAGYDDHQQAYVSDSGQDLGNYTGVGKFALASQRVAPFCSVLTV